MHSTGMNCAEIADSVHLSSGMVRLELDTLRERLGACNLYSAQVLAIARGYLEIDGREGCLFVPEAQPEVVAA